MGYDDKTRDLEELQAEGRSPTGGTPPSSMPPAAMAPAWIDDPLRVLSSGLSSWESGFPEYDDEVEALDPDAYDKIRKCPATAGPINKLALLLSTFEFNINGEGMRGQQIQDLLRQIPWWPSVCKHYAWAWVEGVRFGWLTAIVDEFGRVIPSIRGHRKVKAGGYMRWDGTNVIQAQRWTSSTIEPGYMSEARTLPRHRVIAFHPSNDPNPEGDTDLAWMLLQFALSYGENQANRKWYGRHHALPVKILQAAFDKMDVRSAITAHNNAQERIKDGGRQGFVGQKGDLLYDIVEPGGTSWQYLLEDARDIRQQVHMLILQNSLTSETNEAGPTGSSKVHESDQWMAVNALARSLSETLTRELLPFVEFANDHWLAPREDSLRIELAPPPTNKAEVTPSDALQLRQAVGCDTDWLFDIFGAVRPEGLPDILTAPQPMQFPFMPPTSIMSSGGDTSGSIARLSAMREDQEAVAHMGVSRLGKMIDAAVPDLASGYGLTAQYAQEVTRYMAQAHLAGALSMRRHLPDASKTKLRKREELGNHTIKLTSASDLTEMANRYAEYGALAQQAADATLRARIQRRLVAFIRAGGEEGDSEAFTTWLSAQAAKGGGTLGENYAKTVLRNAVNTAFSAGRLEEYRKLQPALGLRWQYLTAGDEAVRDEHAIFNGLVFTGGPESDAWIPPNDHNCRCDWAVVDADTPTTADLRTLPRPAWDYAPTTTSRELRRMGHLTAPERALAMLRGELVGDTLPTCKLGWITIGGKHGDDDEDGKHGGTPVFIEAGVITKGPAAVKDRKIADVAKEKRPSSSGKPKPAAKPAESSGSPKSDGGKAAADASEPKGQPGKSAAASASVGAAAMATVTGREPTEDELDRLQMAEKAARETEEDGDVEYWGSSAQPLWRPGVNPTVDAIVTREGENGREVLLIKRKDGAVEGGKWAIPGGFVDDEHSANGTARGKQWEPGHETPRDAAIRELAEETGLDASTVADAMEEVGVYDKFGRDPRDNPEAWAITNAYKLHLDGDLAAQDVEGLDDASDAQWVPLEDLQDMDMAFDHGDILGDALGAEIGTAEATFAAGLGFDGWSPPGEVYRPKAIDAGADGMVERDVYESGDYAEANGGHGHTFGNFEDMNAERAQVREDRLRAQGFDDPATSVRAISDYVDGNGNLRRYQLGELAIGKGDRWEVTQADMDKAAADDKAIEDFISKRSEIQGGFDPSTPLYRGVYGDFAESLLDMKPGQRMTWKSTSSTSTSREYAEGFTSGGSIGQRSALLEVVEGVRRSASITDISQMPEEREVLIGKDSRFEIVSITEEFEGDPTPVVRVREVNDDAKLSAAKPDADADAGDDAGEAKGGGDFHALQRFIATAADIEIED